MVMVTVIVKLLLEFKKALSFDALQTIFKSLNKSFENGFFFECKSLFNLL